MCLARYAETNVRAAISAPTAVGSPLIRGLEDIRHQNGVIGRACRDFPDRFPIGLALIEPRFGKLGIEEADKAMSELGLVGIVGHPPISDWCIPFVEAAAARKGLCNLHLNNELAGEIARMFPGTTFIVHASTYTTENLNSLENVWFEVVQYPDGRGTEWDFNKLVSRVGKERVMFGADLPYYDYRLLQRIIEDAKIDDELKDRIAWRNAETLIRKFRPNWRLPETPVTAPRIYEPQALWACNPQKKDRLTVYA
jgi:predicted TIM-barrel fold metal-dependent hydrolase